VTTSSPTVLCVDDRAQALELRKAALEPHDYRVKTASSSSTAMKILEETSVDAVLLEYKLEGMDVEAVACHIKRRFPTLPVILLSAYSEMPERILWLVDEYVMKSELPERLVPVLEKAMRLASRKEPTKALPRSPAEQSRDRRKTEWKAGHNAA
jgi:DNA-binding NtrC family response regulator